jgi:hypothetical protein
LKQKKVFAQDAESYFQMNSKHNPKSHDGNKEPISLHGGWRPGAGRKARPSAKSKPIWCGQISEEDRAFIMRWLSPDERFQVLMAAANTASSGQRVRSVKKDNSNQ